MPTYRKLHTKVLDSNDFNCMPDDFTRLMWVLLPLKCDREGRGLCDPHWLKSVLFPRRKDVTVKQIEKAMTCYIMRGMIETWISESGEVFEIVSWKKYQTGTDREAPSFILRNDLVDTYAPQGQEEVKSGSRVSQAKEKHAVPDTVTVFDTVPVPEYVLEDEVKKLKTHPALVTWRETHDGHYLSKALWKEVAEMVGTEPAEIARWKQTIIDWIACGWYANNYKGIKDYFLRKELPSAKRSNGSAQAAAPQPKRKLRSPLED